MLGARLLRTVVLSWLALAGLGSAQETGRPWGFLSTNADLQVKPEAAPPLDLRANVTVPVYLYLVNPTEDTPTVAVQIRSGGATVGTIANVTLPSKGFARYAVGPTAAPAGKAAADGVAIATDAKSQRLTFRVAVSNINRPGEAANESNQLINFVSPSTYLGDTTAEVTGTGNQLIVKVKANNLQGPPCMVELVLSPDEIPGLQLGELKGVTRATLTAEQPTATLVAGDLKFAPGSTGEGRLSLTVDGIERAIVMKGSFRPQVGATSEPFKIEAKRDLRVLAPKSAKPGDEVIAKFEAINAPESANVAFTVSPGQPGVGTPVQTQNRSGPREQRASVKVADDGSLAVTTVVKDWAFRFDTRNLYGPVTLKAAASSGGDAIDANTVVIFDDTPPTRVQVLAYDPMKPPVRGRHHPIRTIGEDKDSGIAKVEYYVGVEPPAPGPDGKTPAEPKPVVGALDLKSPREAPAWFAEINLPEKKGLLPIWVRYTNGVGLSTVVKYELDVLDPPNGSLKGQVIYNDRPQNQGVKVWLMTKDLKTLVREGKVTGADNKFELKDIPAGDYVLAAEMKNSAKPMQNAIAVTVKEGPEVTNQDIPLKKP